MEGRLGQFTPEDIETVRDLASPLRNHIMLVTDPARWLKGSVGIREFKGASFVTNEDILRALHNEGDKWEQPIRRFAASYVRSYIREIKQRFSQS